MWLFLSDTRPGFEKLSRSTDIRFSFFFFFFRFCLFDAVRFQYSQVLVVFLLSKCSDAFLIREFYSSRYFSFPTVHYQHDTLFNDKLYSYNLAVYFYWLYQGFQLCFIFGQHLNVIHIHEVSSSSSSSSYYYYYYYYYLYWSFSHQRQLMVFHWSLSDNKSPQVFRTLFSILAVLNNVVVWMVSTRPPTSNSSSPFSNLLVTVPKAPITIGIIVTFMFHSFFFPIL